MKVFIQKLNISPQYFLRKCGYIQITNPYKADEISYVRSLQSGRFYPRFHIYIETSGIETTLNLHLDAKKPSYEGTAAHSGEYEGKIIEEEVSRIKKISEKLLPMKTIKPLGFSSKKPWWKRMLGI
jgi:hypothetical protein